MVSLSSIDVLDSAKADLESTAGDFLKEARSLVALSKSPSATISQRARDLYQEHLGLENQLMDATKLIDQMKEQGVFTFATSGGLAQVSDLTAALISHMRRVTQLQRDAGVYDPGSQVVSNLAVPALVAIGILVAGWTLWRLL